MIKAQAEFSGSSATLERCLIFIMLEFELEFMVFMTFEEDSQSFPTCQRSPQSEFICPSNRSHENDASVRNSPRTAFGFRLAGRPDSLGLGRTGRRENGWFSSSTRIQPLISFLIFPRCHGINSYSVSNSQRRQLKTFNLSPLLIVIKVGLSKSICKGIGSITPYLSPP